MIKFSYAVYQYLKTAFACILEQCSIDAKKMFTSFQLLAGDSSFQTKAPALQSSKQNFQLNLGEGGGILPYSLGGGVLLGSQKSCPLLE